MILTKARSRETQSNTAPLFPSGLGGTKQLLLIQMAALRMCGHFLGAMIVDTNEQTIIQGDNAAKVIASIIIAGIAADVRYGLFHWIIFE